MKDIVGPAVCLLAAAFLAAVLLAVWMIGAQTLRDLAFVMAGAVSLALILASSALPVRAWRKRDATGEANHYYHDGTTKVIERHTLDGRAPAQNDIRLLQLPATGAQNVYPELLRASYRAGLLAAPNGSQADQTAPPAAELHAVDPAAPVWEEAASAAPQRHVYAGGGEWADWSGDLRP